MAAQQATGRVCACGCGASLDGRSQWARYTVECALRKRDERDIQKTQKKSALRLASRPQENRVCGCGCGKSINGSHAQTQFAPECVRRRKRDRWKAYDASRSDRMKAPNPRGTAGWQRKTATEAPYVPTMKCGTCCDMQWARRPDRPQEYREGYAPSERMVGVQVVDHGLNKVEWRCKECNELYAPEPPPERQSLLRSSAGMATKASEVWGYNPEYNAKSPKQMVAVREAKRLKNAKGQNDGEV